MAPAGGALPAPEGRARLLSRLIADFGIRRGDNRVAVTWLTDESGVVRDVAALPPSAGDAWAAASGAGLRAWDVSRGRKGGGPGGVGHQPVADEVRSEMKGLAFPSSLEAELAQAIELAELAGREGHTWTADPPVRGRCSCAGSGHVTERIAGGRLRVVYPCPTCSPSAWREVGGWDDLDVSGFRVGSEGLTIVVSDLQPTVQDGDGSDTVEREGAGSARDAQPAPAPRATGMAPMHTQYDAPPLGRQP